MTPVDYIRLALKLANVEGIGQAPDAEDTQDVFVVLQAMLAQWSKKRWLIPNEVDNSITSTGAASYTVGANGDIDMTRPDSIEAAYIRLLPAPTAAQQVDIPLTIIEAHEDWASITNKSVTGFTVACFYDSGYPLGQLYLYPVSGANQCEIHIITKATMPSGLTLSSDIALPPEYQEAILYSLAVRCRVLFGAAADPALIGLAKTALNVIRGANAQVPVLRMPRGIGWYRGARWGGHGIPNFASLG